MQFVTFVERGDRRIGVHVDGKIVDVRAALASRLADGGEGNPWELASALVPSDLVQLIERGEPALAQIRSAVDYALERQGEDGNPLARHFVFDINDVRVTSPLINPGKVIAIGLNYLDHARETGMEPPKQPIFFTKYSTAIVGPGDPVVLPPTDISNEVDYEVEFAVVIGKAARNVSEDDALDHVFGYTILNDISARDLQFEDGQWVKGKSLDTFAPMGPWVVTKDEIADPHNLKISLSLNGEVKQNSSTSNLIFNVPQLIAYLSKLFTLRPGDVIATGTPHGVGMALDPKRYLKPGDTMVCEIEGIGQLENPVIRAE